MTYQQNVRTGRVITLAKESFLSATVWGIIAILALAFNFQNITFYAGGLFAGYLVSSFQIRGLVVKNWCPYWRRIFENAYNKGENK